jgi:hypothetical protein
LCRRIKGGSRRGFFGWWSVGSGGEAVALFAGTGVAESEIGVTPRGECSELHEGSLPSIEWLVAEDNLREMLGLLRVNSCGHALPEFSGDRSFDAVWFHAKRTRNLRNRETRPLTLILADRCFNRPAC